MSYTNILPVPVNLEVLSEKVFVARKVTRKQGLDEILSSAEQHRFRTELGSDAFQNEGYVLKTGNNHVNVYAPSAAGFFYGQNTAKKLITPNKGKVPDVLIVDYPAFSVRGFMEGFTGIPWGIDRENMIRTCSKYGFNAYVLGPNEYHLLGNWKKQFPEDYKRHLAKLADVAKQNFVKFAYKIIPFGVDMTSEADIEAFKRKSIELADLGIDAVIVALDDFFMMEKTTHHAKIHAAFANKISEELAKRNVALFLIPAVYYGIEPQYHRPLGIELNKNIQVGWTGMKVESRTVTSDEVESLEELLARKPFLGFNFPVLNEIEKKRRMHLGPLKGLNASLTEHLGGILFNFMSLPYASLIPGGTCADFAWNPLYYDPATSIRNSCATLGSPDLIKLVELNPETTVDSHAVHPITNIVSGKYFYRRLPSMSPGELQYLRETFETMCLLGYRLMHSDIPDPLYRELKQLIDKADKIGSWGLKIVDGTVSEFGIPENFQSALKIISGYRLSGLVLENWILKKMGFPASSMRYMRPVFDTIDTIFRKRHRRQRVK